VRAIRLENLLNHSTICDSEDNTLPSKKKVKKTSQKKKPATKKVKRKQTKKSLWQRILGR